MILSKKEGIFLFDRLLCRLSTLPPYCTLLPNIAPPILAFRSGKFGRRNVVAAQFGFRI